MRSLIVLLVAMAPAVASAQWLVEPPNGLFIESRAVEVELRHGMALVTTRVVLRSELAYPIEAQLRVPAPSGSGLAGLEVCSGDLCRRGVPATVPGVYEAARRGRRPSPEPVAIAVTRAYPHGRHLFVEAAPIAPGTLFTITTRYVAPAPTEDAVTSFTLPPPGFDASGPPAITGAAPGLEDVAVEGWTVRARLPEGAARATAWSVRCGESRCRRLRVVAGPVPAPRRDVFAIIDVSPSARAADPLARAAAFGALLDALAPDARVTRVAFARHAALLDETPLAPADVPRDAALPSLGNTTRLGEAWSLVRDRVRSARAPLVVLFGDGALGRDPTAAPALTEITDSGAELSLVTLVDERYVADVLTTAIEQSMGLSTIVLTEAQRDRVPRLVAPLVASHVYLGHADQGPLRAGEERVFETLHEGGGAVPVLTAFGRRVLPTTPRQRWADGFATRMNPEDPRAALVAASPDQFEAARKGRVAPRGAGFGMRFTRHYPRIITCGCCVCRVRGSISREAFGRIRRRLLPRVRACFMDARAGRASWSARATLSLVLEHGELVSAAVPQSTDPALNECLAHVADDFEDFPAVEGVVQANFSFYSEAEAEFSQPPEAVRPALDAALRAIGVDGSAVEADE